MCHSTRPSRILTWALSSWSMWASESLWTMCMGSCRARWFIIWWTCTFLQERFISQGYVFEILTWRCYFCQSPTKTHQKRGPDNVGKKAERQSVGEGEKIRNNATQGNSTTVGRSDSRTVDRRIISLVKAEIFFLFSFVCTIPLKKQLSEAIEPPHTQKNREGKKYIIGYSNNVQKDTYFIHVCFCFSCSLLS